MQKSINQQPYKHIYDLFEIALESLYIFFFFTRPTFNQQAREPKALQQVKKRGVDLFHYKKILLVSK
jgi:hypothetical protein